MSRITAIEPQQHDPDRVNIHLDGLFAFPLTRMVAAWLKIGQDLNEEKIASLQNEDAVEKAYRQALLFLSYRTRSAAEIRLNLQKHKVPEDVIERTLEKLKESRLVDDDQFARAWVDNRNSFRPRGLRLLSVELRQKGLSDETTQAALQGLDEQALAYQAGLKNLRRLEGLVWQDFRTKLYGYLARRGFPYSVISPVVGQLWNETHTMQHMSDNEEIS